MPLRTHSRSHPEVELYYGFDKYENEDLIKYAWDGDVWFHVDKHSSAHIYARLGGIYGFDDIPQEVLMEAAQLTKANSIEGCKLNNLRICYTPASNLHKDNSMETGEVGFKNNRLIKYITVPEKDKELLRWFK